MMYENDLLPDPSRRSQIVQHLPIAIIVAGVVGVLVSLHLAVTSVVVLAVCHVLLGAALLLVRRRRAHL